MRACYQLGAIIIYALLEFLEIQVLSSLTLVLVPCLLALVFLHLEFGVEGSSSDRASLFGSLTLVYAVGGALFHVSAKRNISPHPVVLTHFLVYRFLL